MGYAPVIGVYDVLTRLQGGFRLLIACKASTQEFVGVHEWHSSHAAVVNASRDGLPPQLREEYETVAVAAEGCDVLLATGMSHFVARSVAEKRAIPHREVPPAEDPAS